MDSCLENMSTSSKVSWYFLKIHHGISWHIMVFLSPSLMWTLIYDEEIFQNIFLHGRHFKSISSRLRSGNFNIFSNHDGYLKLNTSLVIYNEEISKLFASVVDNIRAFLAVWARKFQIFLQPWWTLKIKCIFSHL